MSETMEIPEEIRAAAYAIFDGDTFNLVDEVARALLAERLRTIEECAKVAEVWDIPREQRTDGTFDFHYVAGIDDAGEAIAAAIRSLK